MLFNGATTVLIVLMLLAYMGFEKYMETKQIESISNIDGLTYEELQSVIKQIMK